MVEILHHRDRGIKGHCIMPPPLPSGAHISTHLFVSAPVQHTCISLLGEQCTRLLALCMSSWDEGAVTCGITTASIGCRTNATGEVSVYKGYLLPVHGSSGSIADCTVSVSPSILQAAFTMLKLFCACVRSCVVSNIEVILKLLFSVSICVKIGKPLRQQFAYCEVPQSAAKSIAGHFQEVMLDGACRGQTMAEMLAPIQKWGVGGRVQHKQLAPDDLAQVAMCSASIIMQPSDCARRAHKHLQANHHAIATLLEGF